MDKLEELKNRVRKFNDDRDWGQFHTPDNLAKSIAIEASELLECFQWSSKDFNKQDVCEEMADVYTYLLDLADVLDVDLIDITNDKMIKNEKKYPIEKAKGNSNKYTKL